MTQRKGKSREEYREWSARRRQAMYGLRLDGFTYEVIGKQYGLSRERARQIIKRAEREAEGIK